MDSTGRVLGHLTPVWSDEGVLTWARLGASIAVCSADATVEGMWSAPDPQANIACAQTEANYIDGLVPTDDGVVVNILEEDGGLATWVSREFSWDDVSK